MSAAHLPAGLMGIDKGHKDQSPLEREPWKRWNDIIELLCYFLQLDY